MRISGKWILAAGLVVSMAALSSAQPPRGGQGFGMMGGGNLVAMKDVQKELKLTEDQITKVTELAATQRKKMTEMREQFQDLSPEERREKMTAVNAENQKAVKAVLNPDQSKRLRQIELQNMGIMAFNDADVGKILKITDEQKETFKTINDDLRQEMQSMFQGGGGGGDFQENMKKMNTLRKESFTKAVAALSGDQKKAWKEMTGDTFEVKFDAAGFGGQGKGKKKKDKVD